MRERSSHWLNYLLIVHVALLILVGCMFAELFFSEFVCAIALTSAILTPIAHAAFLIHNAELKIFFKTVIALFVSAFIYIVLLPTFQ